MGQEVYRVAVIGCGVVGGALVEYLETLTSHRVYCFDPGKGLMDDISFSDVAFVNVPVPCKGFEQDDQILSDAIRNIPKNIPVIIRSTILPGTCDRLQKKFDRPICHLPEFLTERRAFADMKNGKNLYLGLSTLSDQIKLLTIVKNIFTDKDIIPIGTKEAEMLKFAHNCFGALKVTYFNLIYDLCKKDGIDFNVVRLAAVNATGFINDEHTRVPGPDGKLGYGGKCFPVNVENFIGYCRDKNQLSGKLFEDVYCLNRLFRGEK